MATERWGEAKALRDGIWWRKRVSFVIKGKVKGQIEKKQVSSTLLFIVQKQHKLRDKNVQLKFCMLQVGSVCVVCFGSNISSSLNSNGFLTYFVFLTATYFVLECDFFLM